MTHMNNFSSGAVAEYGRTLIAGRMRRGRQAKLLAGRLLPRTIEPYGYRIHPDRQRDAVNANAYKLGDHTLTRLARIALDQRLRASLRPGSVTTAMAICLGWALPIS
jgi:hypothetical protein